MDKSKSNYKKIKLKKLRKTHIWPSIVFLLFSMIIATIACIGLLLASIMYLDLERIDYTGRNASFISSSLDTAIGYEQNVLDNVRNTPAAPQAIYVFDEYDNIIACYGEQTYKRDITFNSITGVYTDKDYSFCADDSYKDSIIDEKNGSLSGEKLVKALWELESILNDEKLDVQHAIYNSKFWFKFELSQNRTVLIRADIPIYVKDLLSALLISIVSLGVMVLPIIFLFINVIFSVHNQRRMTRLLYTDTITGGNSYSYFDYTAGKALKSRFKAKKSYMIVDVTVMKYRSYCNYHGIRAGEEVLESLHDKLNAYMKKNEFCSHSGKSSFVLFLESTDRESDELRVQNIVNELSKNLERGGLVLHAGIYFSKPHTSKKGKKISTRRITDPADCFNLASAARATIVDENTPAVAVYNYKLLEEQLWGHKVEEKMQKALENEEFQVYIQPKYDPVTEKLAGAEALVRWINDEDGFISPGRFIPIFEKNGFITKLDDYMLSHVAELQAKWINAGKTVVPISVNVSRAHFSNPDLAQHICSIIDKYNIPHNVIEIELTESAFFDNKKLLLNTVHELSRLGFEISMDDFGAGYSSLNSLKDLPLDVLKLDAEFFRGEDEENRGEIVVSQAISLAKKLNMRIVAEGVEKKEQVDFLAGQGCDMIQGFYFAKPMPASEYAEKLQENDMSEENDTEKISEDDMSAEEYIENISENDKDTGENYDEHSENE